MGEFNPKPHLIDIRGKQYLEVKWRLVWLRQAHPDWAIDTELLDITDLEKKVGTLQTQNTEIPGGRVEQGATSVTLRTRGRVQSVSAFGDLVVKQQDGHAVLLRDVATIEDGMAEATTKANVNGESSVLLTRGDPGETALEEVLDRLDVVHRLPLDGGQFLDLRRPELGHDPAEGGLLVVGEVTDARDHLVVGEVDQPLDLDVDPHPVERRLGEELDEWRDDGAVPTVEGTEGHRRVGVRERGHVVILPETPGRPARRPCSNG